MIPSRGSLRLRVGSTGPGDRSPIGIEPRLAGSPKDKDGDSVFDLNTLGHDYDYGYGDSVVKQLMKSPSAFLPPLMSFAALLTVAVHIAIFGIARQADEGLEAHLWQLLMATQIPIIAFFALRWLPREPIRAVAVLVLQGVAALAALAPVYLLRW